MAFCVPEKSRLVTGRQGSSAAFGNNGAFLLKVRNKELFAIASDGGGWEHVSVTSEGKCPTWEQMCIIKSIFWDEEDCVMQYHPPKSEYVNVHPHCLHLWRPTLEVMPRPPRWMIG